MTVEEMREFLRAHPQHLGRVTEYLNQAAGQRIIESIDDEAKVVWVDGTTNAQKQAARTALENRLINWRDNPPPSELRPRERIAALEAQVTDLLARVAALESV